nr:PREDICTED: sialic acid-binding Ig-like lectin 5 isoform X2 [Anolis carolinensis]|eukprot:XP_008115521.1 PREDICTED: sialic acid-binding Ig-like lectin 5 isoform X2 [Anolis carolinensis]
MKSLSMLDLPILAFFFEGIWSSSVPGFTLTAPTFVTIQRGLSVHIPCQFTYRNSNLHEQISAYWFKNKEGAEFCFEGASRKHCVSGLLVATNDGTQSANRATGNRFQLIGDVNRGDCSFSIAQVQVEDKGIYYFRIVGNRGLKFSYSTMFDYISPEIFVADQNEDMKITVNLTKLSQAEKGEKATSIVVAQAGSSIRLLCHMDGRPNLTLTWMKGNISNPNGRKNHVLRLTKITPEDAGEYQCQAENQQQTVRVTVQYAPELSISPQRNTTCWHQDNSVLCHCSFKAQPPAQIQWQADGETITEESSRKNLKVTSLIQENEVTSSFNWTDSIEIDHRILCVASNSFGVYTVQFLLSTFKDGNTKDCSPGLYFSLSSFCALFGRLYCLKRVMSDVALDNSSSSA